MEEVMSKMFNVVQAKQRPGQEKVYWHKVGIAFDNEKGMSIKLDSLPTANAEGETWVSLFEQDENRGFKAAPSNKPIASQLDDEIPF